MGLQFDRPVGAPRDVAELEYCCAIRQTDTSQPVRANGSLSAEDVRLHLLSRHGVVVSIEQVETLLLLQLAGGQEYAVVPNGDVAASSGGAATDPEGESATRAGGTGHDPNDRSDGGAAEAGAAEEEEFEVDGGGISTEHERTGREAPDALRVSFVPESARGAWGEFFHHKKKEGPSGSISSNHSSKKHNGDGPDANNAQSPTPAHLLRRVTPLDLVQQVSLLLVPELVKLRRRTETEAGQHQDEEKGARGGGIIGGGGGSSTGHDNSCDNDDDSVEVDVDDDVVLPPSTVSQSFRNLFHNSARDDVAAPPTIDPSAVEVALLVLLENAGLTYGTTLTTDVLHQIMLSFGEEYWDDSVVEQMIRMAAGTSTTNDGDDGANDGGDDSGGIKLTSETFLRALTGDVADWYDPLLEMRASTHFADAGASTAQARKSTSKRTPPPQSPSSSSSSAPLSPSYFAFARTFTASSIDYTADTYASLTWAVLVWFLLAGFFFLYMFDGLRQQLIPLGCNPEGFGCKIGNAVMLWIVIMIKLCLVGFVYIGLSTLGNSVYLLTADSSTIVYKFKATATITISLATVFASTVLAYLFQVNAVVFDTTFYYYPEDDTIFAYYDDVTYYEDNATVVGNSVDNSSLVGGSTLPPQTPGNSRRPVSVLLVATLAVGILCMLTQVAQLVRALLPRNLVAPARFLSRLVSSANSMEHTTKVAASHKVREMVRNAVSCHASHPAGPTDAGLAASVKYEARNPLRLLEQNVDGRVSHALFHFQQRLRDKETVGGLFYTWNGLLRGVCTLTTLEGIWVHPRQLWCNMGQWVIIVWFIVLLIQLPADLSKGYELEGITVQQLERLIFAGGVVGLVACLVAVIRFIPSAITTVLMFRSGIHSTLRDNRSFYVYRIAQDTSTALFGSAIWGLVVTGGIIWGTVSLLAFSFVWATTREVMLSFLAQVMGVVLTIFLKVFVLMIFRRAWYRGFYRERPGGANVFMVLVECWNLALSSGYILARSIKFIVLSILYISRVDTPFLADGAGWLVGDIPLDTFAIAFRKDILIHDAHRHPYMERWATLFLLKIRHGDKFGTQAGAAWRILFTMALMPWLRNYRVHPKLRASDWSTRHSSTLLSHGVGGGGDSYYDLHSRNESLERENHRLKVKLARKVAEVEELTSTYFEL